MASNYSSDPNSVAPTGNASSPQNGSSGAGSHVPQTPSAASAPSTGGSGGRRGLASGTLLSDRRYQIEKLVAAGGMGAVYRAIDTRFNRPCAVKEMLDDFRNEVERTQSVEWFSREATLLLDLNHPCIPRVRDFFVEQGRHYLVMDFIEGRTLAEVLDKDENVMGVNGARGVPESRARSWAHQLCGVLSYLHHQDPPIIFRDLKPSNIMVTNRDEIKLIDFGIARTFQTQQQSTVIMTLGYAPPEQLHGMPEPRSDLFALGATLHKVLTRHDSANNKPSIFQFPTVRSLRPDISVAFDQIIMRALAPNVDQRWPNAEEMDRALLGLPAIAASPTTFSPAQWAPSTQIASSGQHSGGAPGSGQHSGGTPGSGPGSALAPRNTTTGPAGPYLNNALSHLSAARIEPAYEAIKMAHVYEPNNALVHKLFGQVYARRRPAQADTAVQAYNRSLQLDPNDAETHKLVGDVWHYLRPNPTQAITAYSNSLRLNPNDFEAHERLGENYEKTGRPDLAVHEYQEAIRLAVSQPEMVRLRLYFALGQLTMRMRQWSLSEHAFVQVLVLNPSDHQTRFLLSQVYEQEGKLEEAFRECGYVMNGPLNATNPAVSQMYYRLKSRLGR